MNVLLAGNNSYAFGTKVFLVSLLENSKGQSVTIYFMYNCLNEENRNDFKQIVGRYCDCSIQFLYLPMEMFEGMPLEAVTNPYITIETYFRMAMSEILPVNVNRILYLDTDIIVNKNILELYNTPMNDGVAACVCEDYGIVMAKKIRTRVFNNLKFEKNDQYFNAGVMLLNMNCIRENFSFDIFKDFINKNYDKLMFHDQDVLNVLFKGMVKYVDFHKYNCRPFYYSYSRKSENNIYRNAYIIHYGEKPWNNDFCDLAGEVFWKYAVFAGYNEEHNAWTKKNNEYKRRHRMKIILSYLKRNMKMLWL